MDYRLFINSQWVDGVEQLEVTNKYTHDVFTILPTARREDVDVAITATQRTAPLMADMPAFKRAEILQQAAAMIEERKEELASTIATEAGKALKFARAEVVAQ